MIVIPEQKIGFIHIHKTAGESVRLYLGSLGYPEKTPEWRGKAFHGRVNYRQIIAAAPELGNFRFFAICRNPWARLVSTYEWWKSKPDGSFGINSSHVRFLKSFDDFVAGLAETKERSGSRPWLADRLAQAEEHSEIILSPRKVFYGSQRSYVVDASGKIAADLIAFERLSVELPAYLTRHLGRPVQWKQFHANRSGMVDWRSYYSDATADVVGKLFAEDIRLLDYQFAS